MRPAAILSALVILAGVACAPALTDPFGRQGALQEHQRRYTQLVRWGEIERAAAFVDPAQREKYLENEDAFDSFRITDFEIGPFDYRDDDTVRVRVSYHGYSIATLIEQRIRETQEWYQPEGASQWMVRPEVEVIVDALAGAR